VFLIKIEDKPFWRYFWTVHHNFKMSFCSVKEFYNYNDHSLCLLNSLGAGPRIRENHFVHKILRALSYIYIFHYNLASSFGNEKKFIQVQKHNVNHWWSFATCTKMDREPACQAKGESLLPKHVEAHIRLLAENRTLFPVWQCFVCYFIKLTWWWWWYGR